MGLTDFIDIEGLIGATGGKSKSASLAGNLRASNIKGDLPKAHQTLKAAQQEANRNKAKPAPKKKPKPITEVEALANPNISDALLDDLSFLNEGIPTMQSSMATGIDGYSALLANQLLSETYSPDLLELMLAAQNSSPFGA